MLRLFRNSSSGLKGLGNLTGSSAADTGILEDCTSGCVANYQARHSLRSRGRTSHIRVQVYSACLAKTMTHPLSHLYRQHRMKGSSPSYHYPVHTGGQHQHYRPQKEVQELILQELQWIQRGMWFSIERIKESRYELFLGLCYKMSRLRARKPWKTFFRGLQSS